nr:reverse transcriptase domain-containing protein [Tanacetum cinerariifolium]
EGADVELEAEEPDGVPEAVTEAGSQRPFAIRDFPIGVYETGESSTARDPQFVGGKVVERLKVLESKENATLRKKLAEKEVLLDLTRMERDRAERRLFESIRWNKRFYLEMKSLFARFGTPRAIISDRGTHFCNDQFAKVMLKYDVTHRLATAYHPQTSGQ